MAKVYLKEGDTVNVSATTFTVVTGTERGIDFNDLEFYSIGDGAEVEFWDDEDQQYYRVCDEIIEGKAHMYYDRKEVQ